MEKMIRSLISAIAGIFIFLAIIQTLLSIPEFKSFMIELLQGLFFGLIIGAIVTVIIGGAFLYLAIKGK